MDPTKRKAFANNKPGSSGAPVAKRPRGFEYDDDNEEGFESQLVDFEEEPEILEDDSQPTADETECPDTIVTSSKWCRPPAAKIDAKCDPLIFQQFDLDFYAGKRLQQKPEAVLFFQQDSSILRPDTSTVNSSLPSIEYMANAGNPSASAARINQPCQIADLADEDLAAIFKHLPPHERLLTSGVCRRWYEISRMSWFDIEHLDFNPIPANNIGAIVNQCPDLRSVYASHKSFGQNTRRHFLLEASALSLVRLYDCKVAAYAGNCRAHRDYPGQVAPLQPLSCRNSLAVRDASWHELVLDRIDFVCNLTSPIIPADRMSFLFLPPSLKRLQLSGMCAQRGDQLCTLNMHRQPHLECLMLHGLRRFASPITGILQLVNLKELSFGPVRDMVCFGEDLGVLASNLPLLEVLFLSDIGLSTAENLSDFMTKPSLRILVFAGGFDHAGIPIDLPARKRFPNGIGGPELPLLRVFVGKEASEQIRFAHSTAATFSPITEPMPQFLERVEIAPIFKGVWIAGQIKETARNCGQLWNHGAHDCAVSVNVQHQ